MAFIHGKDTVVTVGGTDISAFVKKSDLNTGADNHDVTVYGATGHGYQSGLTDGTFSMEGVFDNGASGTPETVLRTTLGGSTGQAIEFRPEGTGSGLAELSFTGVLETLNMSDPVDDMVTWSSVHKISGAVDDTDQA